MSLRDVREARDKSDEALQQELQGQVPLHTLRADIDFGRAEARTTFGVIGVKCWINKGEITDETNPLFVTALEGAE